MIVNEKIKLIQIKYEKELKNNNKFIIKNILFILLLITLLFINIKVKRKIFNIKEEYKEYKKNNNLIYIEKINNYSRLYNLENKRLYNDDINHFKEILKNKINKKYMKVGKVNIRL